MIDTTLNTREFRALSRHSFVNSSCQQRGSKNIFFFSFTQLDSLRNEDRLIMSHCVGCFQVPAPFHFGARRGDPLPWNFALIADKLMSPDERAPRRWLVRSSRIRVPGMRKSTFGWTEIVFALVFTNSPNNVIQSFEKSSNGISSIEKLEIEN